MHSLTTLLLLLSTSLTLTTSTTSPNATSPNSTAAAATSFAAPPSAASLPGGNASPALTLFMYADPDCTDINASYSTLVNGLPLSYNTPSPQYPFLGFIMTRNLTGTETLTFYSSTNTSSDACAESVANVTAADGSTGFCLPLMGATCYNLTQS